MLTSLNDPQSMIPLSLTPLIALRCALWSSCLNHIRPITSYYYYYYYSHYYYYFCILHTIATSGMLLTQAAKQSYAYLSQ